LVALLTLTSLDIRCTTQSAIISSSASQAGVAAGAGEEAKDNQYFVDSVFLRMVESSFLSFVNPLVPGLHISFIHFIFNSCKTNPQLRMVYPVNLEGNIYFSNSL